MTTMTVNDSTERHYIKHIIRKLSLCLHLDKDIAVRCLNITVSRVPTIISLSVSRFVL